MIFVKSLSAGTAALIVYVLLIAIILKLRTPTAEGLGAIAIPIWPVLIGAVLVFAAVFCWIFKRGS